MRSSNGVVATRRKAYAARGPSGGEGRVVIRIDFIGYRQLTDTIFTMTARSFGLQPAQLFDSTRWWSPGNTGHTADKAVQRMHVIGAGGNAWRRRTRRCCGRS
jgi:hypothetical protein